MREVGDLWKRARQADKHLATLALDTEIRFASPADRAAFTRDLTQAVTELAGRYHDASRTGRRAAASPRRRLPSSSCPNSRKGFVMPVKKEPSGRRSVQAEVEVTGSPEQVWQAIASGAWNFVVVRPDKTRRAHRRHDNIEFRAGHGSGREDHGMGATAGASSPNPTTVQVLARLRRNGRSRRKPAVLARCAWSIAGSRAPTIGTVSSKVHSYGWLSFFQILRLYLRHFDGQPSTLVQLLATSMETKDKAWSALIQPLGLAAATVGERVATSDGPSELSGVPEVVNPPEWPGMILRLDKPAPAIAHLFALPMGGPVLLSVRFYLYGACATDVAEDVRAKWQNWLDHAFPPAG